MTSLKTCFKCGTQKPLSEFYKHPKMADGHLGKCKQCTKKDSVDHRNKNLDRVREHDRSRSMLPHRVAAREEYAKSPAGVSAHNKANARWIEFNPEKRRAQITLNNALRDGKIVRQPCEKCGERAQAHHPDYSKPLQVQWLCPKHHKEADRKRVCSTTA